MRRPARRSRASPGRLSLVYGLQRDCTRWSRAFRLIEDCGGEAGFSATAASAPPPVEMTILWQGKENGSRFARIPHLSNDETVAKMGHPICGDRICDGIGRWEGMQ